MAGKKTSFKRRSSAESKAKARSFIEAGDETVLDPEANRTRVMTIKINDFEFEQIKKIATKRMSKKSSLVKQLIAEEAMRLGLA